MGTSAAAQLSILMAPPVPRVNNETMRIATRCTSAEQFITVFHRFCSPTSCFIPSTDSRPAGTETAFSIRLADGTPMLRGQCIVLETWSTPAASPYKRPGVHIGIRWLTPESVAIFDQLLARAPAQRDASGVAVAEKPPTELVPIVETEDATPTVQMPAVVPSRLAGSPFVLPANPLTDLDDDAVAAFVECTMSEEPEDREAIPAAPIGDAADATVPVTRPPIETLLGVAPFPVPRVDDWPLALPRDTIRDDATPVPAPVERTRPLAIPPRQPADARAAATIIVRGTRPAMARSVMRAITALPGHERRWMFAALGVAVVALLVVVMSSLASL